MNRDQLTEAILKALKASDQTDVEELAIAILQGVVQYAEVIADLPAGEGNTRGLLTALRERIGAHQQLVDLGILSQSGETMPDTQESDE